MPFRFNRELFASACVEEIRYITEDYSLHRQILCKESTFCNEVSPMHLCKVMKNFQINSINEDNDGTWCTTAIAVPILSAVKCWSLINITVKFVMRINHPGMSIRLIPIFRIFSKQIMSNRESDFQTVQRDE